MLPVYPNIGPALAVEPPRKDPYHPGGDEGPSHRERRQPLPGVAQHANQPGRPDEAENILCGRNVTACYIECSCVCASTWLAA